MKILVLGSNGMAGHVVVKYLRKQNYNVHTAARQNADYQLDIEKFIIPDNLNTFDYVINCVGVLVKDSNDNPDRAVLVNSWFPHYLEKVLKNSNTRIIHLSTDCIFDGKKGNYVESDIHTETNFYGRSKSLGELNNEKDVTFRMSIIGTEIRPNGVSLLNWVLNDPQTTIQGWDNVYWNGITTLQLAKCIEQYICDPKFTGIYHMVNNNVNIDKYSLVSLMNEVFNVGKTVIRTQGPKPVNKILVDTRQVANYSIPDYNTQLVQLRDFI